MFTSNIDNQFRRQKAYISQLGTTQLHLRSPLVIASWSLLFPGFSHLLLSKYICGFLLFMCELFINYQANVNTAIYYSFIGDIDAAKEVLDINWMLLYVPTYIFAFWDGYRTTVDLNKEYKLASREDFDIKAMTINSMEINCLDKKMKGIPKENILAAPMDAKGETNKPLDTIHNSDGLSYLDLACILGVVFMLIGSIYGFVLAWGPIWWGVIGLLTGLSLGFIIKLIINRKYSKGRRTHKKSSEVVVIIECERDQAEIVKNILWDNKALGVSKLDIHNEKK